MDSSSAPCFGFSLARLRDKQLEFYFRSSGLQHLCFQVEPKTTIACWLNPSAAAETSADRAKPAIVLLHGFATCGTWQWHEQVRPLQKKFRIYVPDLIFFGKSTTKGSGRSEIFQAEMIGKALEIMNVSSYSVVGTSYGGFVAFRLAHLYPERVEKVIIANSGVCMTPQDNQELLGRAQVKAIDELLLPRSPAVFRTLARLSIHRFPTFLPSFVLQSILQYFYVENRDLQEEILKGLTLGVENAEPLPTLMQNALLIWGDHDGIFPLELAHRLKKHLGENAELVVLKDAAHCAQAENPREFNRLVESFLLGSPTLASTAISCKP